MIIFKLSNRQEDIFRRRLQLILANYQSACFWEEIIANNIIGKIQATFSRKIIYIELF